MNIIIGDFATKTKDGLNKEEITSDLTNYLNTKYNDDHKDLIVTLIVINIIGIIGIFITLKNKILSTLIIIILLLGDLILLYKLHKKTTLQEEAKKITSRNLNNHLEQITAEAMDYQNMLKGDNEEYKDLNNFLDNLRIDSFINTNNERNIKIGD